MRYAEEIILDRKKLVMIPEYIGPLHIPALESGTITTARGKFTYLLSSNAFQISFHRSQDLYGLDLLVQVLARLVHQDHLNAGLVFLLPNIGDKAYFQFIKTEIDRLSITDRFLFLTEPIEEASSLWKVSDIVIRATNTDGNSLSVLEALTLGVPVIASDCTERPAGCILFRNRDEDDLYRRVKATLIDLPSHRKRLASMRWSDNAASFLRLYSRMETLAHESYK